MSWEQPNGEGTWSNVLFYLTGRIASPLEPTVNTMIFIEKVRGLSVVCKFMSVNTNIVFSAWHHPTSLRVGFKRNLYHLLFPFPFANVHCKIHCALQNSLHAAKLIVHCKTHCALQNSLCTAKFTARCKIHCALRNHVVHKKIIFSSKLLNVDLGSSEICCGGR
jgi:hypothetical protein